MNFINNKIFYSLIYLFLGGGNLIAQNLTVCSVEFPDTVIIGETATLKGYVLNNDDIAFTDDIIVNIDIEDTAPNGILNDGEVNDSITINQTNLAPDDSVYFEKELFINSYDFGAASVDLVVAWPQVSENDGIIDDEADIQLTYVQEEEEEAVANDNRYAYDYLPDTIKDYIEENYPNALIDNISMIQSSFKIELDNEVELIFSLAGILHNTEEDKHYNYEEEDNVYDDDEGNANDDHDYSDDDDESSANDDDDYSDDDDEGNAYDNDDHRDYSDDDDEGINANDDDSVHSDDDDICYWSDDFWDDFWNDEFWDDFWSDDFWDDFWNDDEGGKTNTDDDDLFGDDSLNREKELSPFKITVSKQFIQIVSDDDFKIVSVELFDLNSSLVQRLTNKHESSKISLPIKNSNYKISVLQIYLKDGNDSVKKFNQKIILGL